MLSCELGESFKITVFIEQLQIAGSEESNLNTDSISSRQKGK